MKAEKKNTNFIYYFIDIWYRIVYFFFSFLLTFIVCYHYYVDLTYLYVKPFLKYHKVFIFTELTEPLYVTLKISTITTICVLFPMVWYMIWCFFIPSCFYSERNNYTFFLLFWNVFFIWTIYTSYYNVLPHLFDFLVQYEIERYLFSIQLEARIGSYLSWSLKVSFMLSILAQLPLLSYFLYRLEILCPSFLSQNRKFLIFIFLLTAALLSPPELITQIILTMAFVILYELIIWLGFFHASCRMKTKLKL